MRKTVYYKKIKINKLDRGAEKYGKIVVWYDFLAADFSLIILGDSSAGR